MFLRRGRSGYDPRRLAASRGCKMSVHSYYVGVDLGQSRDYTAVSAIEEPIWVPRPTSNRGWRLHLDLRL